jgi:hypothetical protein
MSKAALRGGFAFFQRLGGFEMERRPPEHRNRHLQPIASMVYD